MNKTVKTRGKGGEREEREGRRLDREVCMGGEAGGEGGREKGRKKRKGR